MAAPKGNKFAIGNTGGRPTTYSPEYGEKLCALIGEGLSIRAACLLLGVSRQTLHNWKRKHQQFAEDFDLALCVRTAVLELKLMSAQSCLEVRILIMQLINVAPHEWGRKARDRDPRW
jgi:transposase-like protein